MKKLTFLIIFTAMALCSTFSQNLGQCYVVGGATNRAGDWDTNKAVKMHKVSDGVFSCILPLFTTNTLERGDGTWFKFINYANWGDGFNPNENITFANGTEYDIAFNGAGDSKFIVETQGWYRIDLNMNTLKCTITALENTPTIVAVGNALYGFDLGRTPSLSKGPDADGFIYTYTYLKANEELKFSNGTEFWENRICPMEDINPTATDGTLYNLNHVSDDKKFKVSTDGWYKISINPTTMQGKFETITELPIENLYIVGDATETGWTESDALAFKQPDENTFEWRGYLTAGQFKFIDEKTFNHSICPEDGDVTFTNGQEYNLKYDGQWKNTGGWDKKFIVSTAGYYSATVVVDGLSLKATINSIIPDYNSMHLVGSATPADYEFDTECPMTLVEDGVFTWTGSLNSGEVKFRAAVGSWDDAFGAVDANINIESETTYDLYWRPLNSAAKDFKFIVSESGKYIIDLNLNTKQVVFTKDTETGAILITDTKTVINRTYYNVGGQEVSSDSKGLVIVKTAFSDGSLEVSKYIVNGYNK
ncbi:MAG: hypothetical protein BGO29_05745 [Bacteroidales bacterium 36-12]|nr:MAG: hypothetical protein BGO29_05745 [Bacteroidales bacterium 36-12]